MLPSTWSLFSGSSVPIPTLPSDFRNNPVVFPPTAKRIFSLLLVPILHCGLAVLSSAPTYNPPPPLVDSLNILLALGEAEDTSKLPPGLSVPIPTLPLVSNIKSLPTDPLVVFSAMSWYVLETLS